MSQWWAIGISFFGMCLTSSFSVSNGVFAVVCQPDAVGYAEDVRVDCHRRLVVNDRGNHIGRFAPDAGQLLQLVDIGRHDAPEIGNQHLRHAN